MPLMNLQIEKNGRKRNKINLKTPKDLNVVLWCGLPPLLCSQLVRSTQHAHVQTLSIDAVINPYSVNV